jgi:hypothetical protein
VSCPGNLWSSSSNTVVACLGWQNVPCRNTCQDRRWRLESRPTEPGFFYTTTHPALLCPALTGSLQSGWWVVRTRPPFRDAGRAERHAPRPIRPGLATCVAFAMLCFVLAAPSSPPVQIGAVQYPSRAKPRRNISRSLGRHELLAKCACAVPPRAKVAGHACQCSILALPRTDEGHMPRGPLVGGRVTLTPND